MTGRFAHLAGRSFCSTLSFFSLSLSLARSLPLTYSLSLSPSSDQFPSSASSCLLNFPFAGFCVAIEDVAGRRAVRRQCACSTFITIALSLSHARSLSLGLCRSLSLPFSLAHYPWRDSVYFVCDKSQHKHSDTEGEVLCKLGRRRRG